MTSSYTFNNSNTTFTNNRNFIIEGTRNTPFVMYNGEMGHLEIKGKSSPENSIEFFNNIYNGLDDFAKAGLPEFKFNVALQYFNTSSAKCLFDIFRKLITLSKNLTKVEVNWFYEEGDDDMLESGEDYSEVTGLKFNFIETN